MLHRVENKFFVIAYIGWMQRANNYTSSNDNNPSTNANSGNPGYFHRGGDGDGRAGCGS